MKKTIRIIIPIILVLAIVVCTGWYLFIYDRAFTRDVLLYTARHFERSGNHNVAAWFYDQAYLQVGDNDAVAIELAEQYKAFGNYTKAEYTLSKAIADGGGADLYIALCKTYVEQDKLLDAVNMLNRINNPTVKAQLDALRPSAPVCTPDPSTSGAYYTQYITVSISAENGTLYVNDKGEFPSIQADLYRQDITLKDGENIIYAIAVGDNGLVSPTSIFGFTVGGVIQKVQFSDAAIEAAYREMLGVSNDKVLYSNDLWTIKEFTVPENAENLEDLKHLAFLEKLTISNGTAGQLSNISELSNLTELSITDTVVNADELPVIGRLPNLQKLTLSGCSLSTAAGLESAKSLTYLDLTNNAIRNITPLKELKQLQELKLSKNALNDLSAISVLNMLTSLDVSYNNLTTLAPITSILGLKRLDASSNALTEITGFQQLTALEHLGLSNNTIKDISPLSSCSTLSWLNISHNSLTDISTLANLMNLADLNFANNKVTTLPKWSVDCGLVNIDGSYNQLKSVEQLSGLKKLNNVFMDYNKNLSSVKSLANCPLLIQVNVYGTKVTQVGTLTSQSIVVNYDPTR